MCNHDYDPELDKVPEDEELEYGLGFDPNAERWERNKQRLRDLKYENRILHDALDVLEGAVEYWHSTAEELGYREEDETVG